MGVQPWNEIEKKELEAQTWFLCEESLYFKEDSCTLRGLKVYNSNMPRNRYQILDLSESLDLPHCNIKMSSFASLGEEDSNMQKGSMQNKDSEFQVTLTNKRARMCININGNPLKMCGGELKQNKKGSSQYA